MDLRHIRSFVAVAEELNFSRAAQRLHMSQPPLSQHIKSLEDEMGVQLFVRTRREVRLTDAGHVFLSESRALLGQFRSAVNATVRAAQSDSGVLRLGVATSALFSVMPRFMSLMKATFPQVDVLVHDMQSQDQVRAIADGSLDIGIVHVARDPAKLHRLAIFDEPLAAVLPLGHPLIEKPDFTIADLANEPMIAISREHGPALFDAIIASCRDADFEPDIKHLARNPMIIFQMVKLGFGVSLVPYSYSQSLFTGLIFRPLPSAADRVHIEAIWHERRASKLTENIVNRILPALKVTRAI